MALISGMTRVNDEVRVRRDDTSSETCFPLPLFIPRFSFFCTIHSRIILRNDMTIRPSRHIKHTQTKSAPREKERDNKRDSIRSMSPKILLIVCD